MRVGLCLCHVYIYIFVFVYALCLCVYACVYVYGFVYDVWCMRSVCVFITYEIHVADVSSVNSAAVFVLVVQVF